MSVHPTPDPAGWSVRVRTEVGALRLDAELAGGRQPLVLAGPNGSGKTTLLRIIAGVHPPTDGEIRVEGHTLLDTARGVDEPPELRRVGYVPQGYGLFPHLTVLDNVAFGCRYGVRSGEDAPDVESSRAVARTILDDLDCADLAHRMPVRLSGGEKQRVALARALAVEPRFLLLDEPLAALDVTVRRSVRTFLARRLRALDRPSLVVTHDVRDVAALDAEVCVLEEGRIVQRGRLEDLRAEPATDFVAEFVAAV